MKTFVIFNPITGDAQWLKHDSAWPSLPDHLSLAEFTNMTWGDATKVPVVVDLATKVWRAGDLPLIELRPAPRGHAIEAMRAGTE